MTVEELIDRLRDLPDEIRGKEVFAEGCDCVNPVKGIIQEKTYLGRRQGTQDTILITVKGGVTSF